MLTQMTLSGAMTVILCYFTEFCKYGANYVKVIEVRPTLSYKNGDKKNLHLTMAIFSDDRERVR